MNLNLFQTRLPPKRKNKAQSLHLLGGSPRNQRSKSIDIAHDQKGFTIASALIGAAAMTMVMLQLTKMSESNRRQLIHHQGGVSAQNHIETVRQALSHQCMKTLTPTGQAVQLNRKVGFKRSIDLFDPISNNEGEPKLLSPSEGQLRFGDVDVVNTKVKILYRLSPQSIPNSQDQRWAVQFQIEYKLEGFGAPTRQLHVGSEMVLDTTGKMVTCGPRPAQDLTEMKCATAKLHNYKNPQTLDTYQEVDIVSTQGIENSESIPFEAIFELDPFDGFSGAPDYECSASIFDDTGLSCKPGWTRTSCNFDWGRGGTGSAFMLRWKGFGNGPIEGACKVKQNYGCSFKSIFATCCKLFAAGETGI